MMAAAFFMTSSSDKPEGLLNRSTNAFFSASSSERLRISSEAFSASATAIFCSSDFALGTSVERSSVVAITLAPLNDERSVEFVQAVALLIQMHALGAKCASPIFAQAE